MQKIPDPLTVAARLRAHVHTAATHLARVLDAIDAIEAIASQFAEQFGDVVKSCGCGEIYDSESWSKLDYVGMQIDDDDEVSELRNCRNCHSTIAVVLGPSSLVRASIAVVEARAKRRNP